MSAAPSVLITGAGGYIGSETIKALTKNGGFSKIIALDVRDEPAHLKGLPITYLKGDIRDPNLHEVMKNNAVSVVVHLASIVNPGKKSSRDFEYSVDVLGTRNILDCCIKAGVGKVIVTTSGASYGYHADNPMWLREDHPLRGNKEFAYSDHKRIVEEMLAEYRKSNPQLKQLVFRPTAVIGSTVKNQITDLFEKPVIMGISGSATPFTFIWDQDVVACILRGITSDLSGTYNLAGDGAVTMSEIAKILHKPFIPIPPTALRAALTVLKKFGLTQYGPEQIMFLQYRPVLSNENLKKGFGYTPMKSSKEAFLHYLDSRKGASQ